MLSETIFAGLEEDDKEPEMMDQRAILAEQLDIEIEDD